MITRNEQLRQTATLCKTMGRHDIEVGGMTKVQAQVVSFALLENGTRRNRVFGNRVTGYRIGSDIAVVQDWEGKVVVRMGGAR